MRLRPLFRKFRRSLKSAGARCQRHWRFIEQLARRHRKRIVLAILDALAIGLQIQGWEYGPPVLAFACLLTAGWAAINLVDPQAATTRSRRTVLVVILAGALLSGGWETGLIRLPSVADGAPPTAVGQRVRDPSTLAGAAAKLGHVCLRAAEVEKAIGQATLVQARKDAEILASAKVAAASAANSVVTITGPTATAQPRRALTRPAPNAPKEAQGASKQSAHTIQLRRASKPPTDSGNMGYTEAATTDTEPENSQAMAGGPHQNHEDPQEDATSTVPIGPAADPGGVTGGTATPNDDALVEQLGAIAFAPTRSQDGD